MKLRKMVLCIMGLCMAFSMTACGKTEKVADKKSESETVIGFVTGLDGLGGQGFSDAVYKGVKQLEEEMGTKTILIESKDVSDFATNLRTICNQGAKIVLVPGIQLMDALKTVAPEYPDVQFIFIDGELEGFDNVTSTLFREQEAAYLLGAFAGLTTNTNKVGYIGGTEGSTQERAMSGFMAGFKTTNPEGECIQLYAGTFNDPGKGKEIATQLYNQGADMVATWAGSVNTGVFQAAEAKGEGYYALGAALGQFEQSPEKIMASQVKTLDVITFNLVKAAMEGTLGKGATVMGIKEGGVDILYNPDKDILSKVADDSVVDTVNKLRDKIVNGEITVPDSKEALEKFEYPGI